MSSLTAKANGTRAPMNVKHIAIWFNDESHTDYNDVFVAFDHVGLTVDRKDWSDPFILYPWHTIDHVSWRMPDETPQAKA